MIYPAKIFFIVFSCAAATVAAETLYKSVNEQGEVTFSDSPPENAAKVQQIEVKPAPTEQQQREGLERERLIGEQANKLGAANTERSQAREDDQAQAPRQVNDAVEPIETYNMDYRNRPGRPLPEHRPRPTPRPVTRPIGRPVQRPTR